METKKGVVIGLLVVGLSLGLSIGLLLGYLLAPSSKETSPKSKDPKKNN